VTTERPRRYERALGAALKRVGETEALYLRENRSLHVLNSTARLLFHCLDRPSTAHELALVMERLTDAPSDVVERDLDEVLPELVRLGAVRYAE
jgi:hypothetical protein